MAKGIGDSKFHRGDLVQVADILRVSMLHLRSGVRAVVMGSYWDYYGSGGVGIYRLLFEDGDEISWYDDDHLTLVEAGRSDLMGIWLDHWKGDPKEGWWPVPVQMKVGSWMIDFYEFQATKFFREYVPGDYITFRSLTSSDLGWSVGKIVAISADVFTLKVGRPRK